MMRKQRRARPGKQAGQTTIEFILSLTLLLAITFFFIQLCLVFGWANYIHYATFMSARAYLAAGPTPDEQAERAKQVMVEMVRGGGGRAGEDRIPALAKGEGDGDPKGVRIGPGPIYSDGVRDSSWMI